MSAPLLTPPLPPTLPLKVGIVLEKPTIRLRSGSGLATSALPLARCSSTPSQPNSSGGSGKGAPSGSGAGERTVERTSSCIFGRSNPFETDFSVKELVGEGGFGKIFKCKSTVDGRWYAIKLEQFWFKPQAYFNPADMRETLMKEALVLARLDHENVCRYFNTWVFGSLVSVDKLRAAGGKNKPDRAADDEASRTDAKHQHKPGPTKDDASKLSPARRQSTSSSTYSSTYEWDDEDDDFGDSDDNVYGKLLQRSNFSTTDMVNDDEDDDDEAVSFRDLGFDMEEGEAEGADEGTVDHSQLASPDAAAAAKPPRQPRRRLLSLESPHASVGPVCTQIDVYIQMALYEGNSLQHWMDQRRVLDAAEAMRIFHQIVAGLKYIHSEGLVHRDIKPANIFLTKSSCVKIGDFGLAKNTLETSLRIPPSQYFYDVSEPCGGGWSSVGDPRVANGDGYANDTFSAGVGTPMYSSPEQIEGSQECDASTDVFSLGVLLCELFCVFSTQMERCVVLTDARKGDVPPRIVSQHPDVASLIRRMVQKDRAKRPSCAEIERSELFRRLCIETQKQKFGSTPLCVSTSQSHWQPVVSPSSSPRALRAESFPSSTLQIRAASHSGAVVLVSATSKLVDELTTVSSSVRHLIQKVLELENDEEALLAQLATPTLKREVVDKIKSLQRERRKHLNNALEAVPVTAKHT